MVKVRPSLGMVPDGLMPSDEVAVKRRQNSKTYRTGKRGFNLSATMGVIHYKDDYTDDNSLWEEIDLTIDGDGKMNRAPYQIEVHSDRLGYRYWSKRNGYISLELIEVGGEPVNNRRYSMRREGNQLFWENVSDGLDLKLLLSPTRAEIFKHLADSNAPRQLKWRVQEDIHPAAVKMVRKILGSDNEGNNLEIITAVTNQDAGNREGIQYRQFDFEEVWTGRVSRRINQTTRQKGWFDDPVYPIIIDQTANENIVANADDGYENNSGSPWISSTTFAGGNNWVFGYYLGVTLFANGGVRFQSLGVPQGATIDSSTLTINITSITGASSSATIFADDVDDAPAWTNNSRPSQIAQTTASTNLTVTTTGDTTANITSIVQEIISRSGWSSGNDIRFALIENLPATPADNFFAYVYDYNQGQTLAARLNVTYTVAGAGQVFPSPTKHPRTNILLRR